jgi:hypothetical protein
MSKEKVKEWAWVLLTAALFALAVIVLKQYYPLPAQ